MLSCSLFEVTEEIWVIVWLILLCSSSTPLSRLYLGTEEGDKSWDTRCLSLQRLTSELNAHLNARTHTHKPANYFWSVVAHCWVCICLCVHRWVNWLFLCPLSLCHFHLRKPRKITLSGTAVAWLHLAECWGRYGARHYSKSVPTGFRRSRNNKASVIHGARHPHFSGSGPVIMLMLSFVKGHGHILTNVCDHCIYKHVQFFHAHVTW